MESDKEGDDLSSCLKVFAEKMSHSIEVKDRTYHLQKYKSCFIGTEAVSWMISEGIVKTPEEAVKLGNLLMGANLIRHVVKEHTFKNEPLFYEFVHNPPVLFGFKLESNKKPLVMMIHGMWGSPDNWSNYKLFFQEKGYEVIVPALRFHDKGPDEKNPDLGNLSMLEMCADLQAIISDIQTMNSGPIVLFGHSMGSLLVQILASRGLCQIAVLLNPAPPSDVLGITGSSLKTYFDVTSKWGFWHKVQKLSYEKARYGLLNCMSEEQAKEEYKGFTWESGRAAYEIGFALLDKTKAAAVDSIKVTCPILVVAGDDDNVLPLSITRKVAEKYKQAVFKSYPKHGHFLFKESGWNNQISWNNIAMDINAWLDKEILQLNSTVEALKSHK